MRVGNLALAPLRRLTGAAQSVLGSNQVRPVARSLYTFVGVFRGQRIETLREVSSDEEEHNTQPRLLWPDDGNDSDDFYDTDDEDEHQQHCRHAGPSEADYASDSLSVPEHDRHSQNDENQYSDQYAHTLDEHDTLALQEDADRSSLPSSRQLFGDDHHSENTLSGDESGDQESTQQDCWQDNQEHDTRAIQEDADRATRLSKRQLLTNDDHHSQDTLRGDDSESQNSTQQGHRLNNQEQDARAAQEDNDRATRPSKRQLFKNDDDHSQNILSGDDSDNGESTRQGYEPTSPVQDALTMQENRDCTPNQPLFNYDNRHSRNTLTQDDCEAEESTQQGYWPDSPAFYGGPIESTSVERPPLHARNGNHRPQEIDRGYRSETVTMDMASLPDNGNRYYADEEFMTPVTDRPRRNRTTPPIADGFESDDESDDYHAIGHAAGPSNASARRPLQVITQKESYNPFIHIPEPQNAEAVHRERARRRAEARDNLGYVIRGQKYLIYPSLYEESEDPELYGSTVLWPSESTRNDADFTFSCPSTQNPRTSEVDEDDEDDDGTTLLPIPKRTQVISDTAQADSSEDEYDHNPEIRSGDSLARPLQIRARPSRTVNDLSVGEDEDEDQDAAPTEAVEEDQSTQSSATIRIADSWLGSNKRLSEDTQPERASKVLIGHSRQSSFAGPFEALKERATVERGGPSQPIFDFSVGAMPALPRAEEEPKWYRLSKSTVTTRIDPRENLAFTIPTALPGSAKQTSEDNAPERRSTILMDQSRWPSCAGPFDAASEQVGVATEQGGPIQATFDFSAGEMPALPKAEEEPRWYRLSKSTTTVRTDPREGASSGTQDGGRLSSSHRGYGSSTYGSGDEDSDSGALSRSFDFEFKPGQPVSEATTSRPTKGHGLVILRPEKHRLEPDTCDVQDDAGGGGEHACSAFDRCWGRRRPVVGLYYWDDEEWSEEWVERRKDKRYLRIRDPANDD